MGTVSDGFIHEAILQAGDERPEEYLHSYAYCDTDNNEEGLALTAEHKAKGHL